MLATASWRTAPVSVPGHLTSDLAGRRATRGVAHVDDEIGHALQAQEHHERRERDQAVRTAWLEAPRIESPPNHTQYALSDDVGDGALDEVQADRRAADPER